MTPMLEAAALPADAIEVGRIAGAWGVKGWFKVLPHSAQPQALFSSKRWFVLPPGAAPAGALRLPIREARAHAEGVVACSPEVSDRDAAEALRGALIYIPRSSFPTPDPDEYYWVDLIGLRVINRESAVLGAVRELLATGAQTTLVLTAEEGGKTVERMIPFVSAFIDEVDLRAGVIRVDWQPDY
ncbi:MAG: ribosome maturation factor RimM [Burkholderiaceae bacterium]|jgi:16S rRNA processing protein RimM|nr:ribosome maturation factor RimM [Burkholderiaceae bacterium]